MQKRDGDEAGNKANHDGKSRDARVMLLKDAGHKLVHAECPVLAGGVAPTPPDGGLSRRQVSTSDKHVLVFTNMDKVVGNAKPVPKCHEKLRNETILRPVCPDLEQSAAIPSQLARKPRLDLPSSRMVATQRPPGTAASEFG